MMKLLLKRVIDLAFALPALALLVVPFALIAMAIKLSSPGPVFFHWERVGKDGRTFIPLKFRTMKHGSRRGEVDSLSKDDPRITRLGSYLRAWGIDELPQLWNVIKGEMSLVGPRPTLRYQVERYSRRQMRRLNVKPGITGWALIHGRNALTWNQRIEYDLWYVKHWSICLDLWIMLRTLVVVARRDGLYGPGNVNDMFGVRPSKGGER